MVNYATLNARILRRWRDLTHWIERHLCLSIRKKVVETIARVVARKIVLIAVKVVVAIVVTRQIHIHVVFVDVNLQVWSAVIIKELHILWY
jgi:hypothetical protein